MHATKKALTDLADKATEEEKTSIEAAIKELEEAIQGNDHEAITAKTEALSQASMPLMQKAYAEQAQPEGGADAGAQASAGGADEGAVDAEFEEVKDDKK